MYFLKFIMLVLALTGDAGSKTLGDTISIVVGDIVKTLGDSLESKLESMEKELSRHNDLDASILHAVQDRVAKLEKAPITPSETIKEVQFVVASHLSEIIPALEGRMERQLSKVVAEAFEDYGSKLRRDLDYALNTHAAKGNFYFNMIVLLS